MRDPYGRRMRPNKLQVLGLATVVALVLISLAVVVVGPVLSADAQGSAQAAGPRPTLTPKARPIHYVTPVLGATGTVTKTSTLPDIPLGKFQNALLADSIADDRGVQLGSIGSGLFPLGGNEYWTVTDRGPNPEVYDDVRTFVVPTFDPTLVHIKVHGTSIDVIDAIPITNADGKPVTGMPNRNADDESTPLAADATTVLPPAHQVSSASAPFSARHCATGMPKIASAAMPDTCSASACFAPASPTAVEPQVARR